MAEYGQAPLGSVLIVDDDKDVLEAAALVVLREQLVPVPAESPAEAWAVLASQAVDLVLLDLNFTKGGVSGEEGLRFLTEFRQFDPDGLVVVVTGHSGINTAVAAMRAGAADFIMKPWNNERLSETIRNYAALRRQRRARTTEPEVGPRPQELIILGNSSPIERVRDSITRVGQSNANTLVYGETGTGKSLVAKCLHARSHRSHMPLAGVDLSVLDESAAELALFGGRNDPGLSKLLAAQGGTLLLDEIGALSPRLQIDLAVVLERGQLVPVGAQAPIPLDVRIVATSRRPRPLLYGPDGLKEALLYQVNTVELFMPPLREMVDDIALLARHYANEFSARYGRTPIVLSEATLANLAQERWSGNVRELRHRMERAVLLGEAELGMSSHADATGIADFHRPNPDRPATFDLRRNERTLISEALARNSFNVTRAARELGLSRAALYRRMEKHGL
jgi:DNA-binding NtrC family response regulator